jgi:uncharacterized protein YeaO (DUF488 family)
MAGIKMRLLQDGTPRWRVSIIRRGIRPFSMTFDEYADAVQWVAENEEAYIHNPEKYHRFREDTREVLKKAYRRARKQ